jgi:hypothetical protein
LKYRIPWVPVSCGNIFVPNDFAQGNLFLILVPHVKQDFSDRCSTNRTADGPWKFGGCPISNTTDIEYMLAGEHGYLIIERLVTYWAVLWSQAVIALMCCHCRTSLDLPFTVHLFVSFWNGLQTDVSDASDASDLRYELVQIDDLVIGT